METKDFLKLFFSKSFENTINDKMMYYSYNFEYEFVNQYIHSLINIPLQDFVNFLVENYNVQFLEPVDVLQFSNFDDCTINICKVIKDAGDYGFTTLEIGKLLENDGAARKDGAYTKYGENHAKTANSIGLLNLISNKFFLSCIGFVLNDLSEQDKRKIINRLILRNNLIKRLIYKSIKNGVADYEFETGFLSDSTRCRRKSNTKKLIDILRNNNENCLFDELNNIKY